ncbi:ferrous iron transporter B [Thermovirga sp.]|uniref:ferrous iron transporter B n=1 Tax=Thermovirga sp. TaxID=2699834 RepID=UPI0025D86BBE|nr:ferrous iron transporter B [Thermovirga sp.]MBO8153867.1 ferrous iron transporter B [Thermovirga sp.]
MKFPCFGCHKTESCNGCHVKCGEVDSKPQKILLVGNPNVGKSAVFSRLTGVHAISSNFPGTTISFTQGNLRHEGQNYILIDVPGTYTLNPTNEAEEVAKRIIMGDSDIVVIVLDAGALERNLYLALQVLELGGKAIVALNMVDEARHKGIEIDIKALEEALGVPVVPTVALAGRGIKELVSRLKEAKKSHIKPQSDEDRWKTIGNIVMKVQKAHHRHHTAKDRLEDITINPLWGVLVGVAVIATSFFAIRRIGEGIINYILDPFFSSFVLPLLENISKSMNQEGIIHSLLLGSLINGSLDFEQSFGLFTTGIYVPIVMVLPYIVAFYTVLSLLEDSGYLPRLAVLFDSLMHRVGLHGFAIVPNLLGLGCNVPGVLATRVLESPRERFIASTLISIAIPCTSLQAMIFGALGGFGGKYVVIVYGSLAVTWIILGRLLNILLPGYSPELIIEIPPYRLPSLRGIGLKLWFRVKGFLFEAIPLVMFGVLLVNLLYISGAMNLISNFLAPFFNTVLGLPASTAGPIILGLLRKDVAVGMLLPLNLTSQEMVISVVMLSMTFPCIATFIVLFKELGFKKMMLSLSIMLVTAILSGATLRLLFLLA